MADTAPTSPDDNSREISLQLGSQGTAFTIGLVAGAIAGVIAVIVVLNYAKK